jgi:hypothetical protein
MITTVDLPDDLVREAEARGVIAGKDLKEMLADGLRLLLGRTAPVPKPHSDRGENRSTRVGAGSHDVTAWTRLRAAWESPCPGLTALEMLDEFRGPVELPPPQR